jgi:multidrug efflux pump subunit AcrA (membrane-fusion protein)
VGALDPTLATSVQPEEAPPPPPEFTGVITARDSRVITADFEGRIVDLNLNTSQRVRAGDSLGRLDDTDLKNQLEKAKASEKAFRSEMGAAGARASALAKAARSQSILARHGAAPLAAVRNAQAEASSAGASTSAASGRLGEAAVSRHQIEELLKKAELRAPIDGVITAVSARKGQVAQKGTVLARIYDTRDLLVQFTVPNAQRNLVVIGGRVELTIDGVNHPIWATIQRVSDAFEPPIDVAIIDADIDDSKLQPDEVRVTANATVRLADTQKTATTTNSPTTTIASVR